jgi:hypothetical protein
MFLSALVDALMGMSAGAEAASKSVQVAVDRGGGGTIQGIAWVGFSGKTFIGGSGSASRVVGRLGAIMNPVLPIVACSWSLSGADAAKFAVNSATGVVRVGAADLPLGTYTWNGVCTHAGAVMSPFSQAFSLQAVGPTSPTIEMVDGPIFNIGDRITFMVKNAPAVPYYAFLGETHGHQDSNAPGHVLFNGGQWEGTLLQSVAAGHSNTTVTFTVPDQKQGPNDAYVQHYIASLSGTGNYSGELAESSWFGVNPAYDRQSPTATSTGFTVPFRPQHTVTVCQSGCTYSSLHTAVILVPDYTLIKIKAIRKGFYRDCISIEGPNTGGPGGGAGGPNITHIWIKGVSDDGDLVHLQAAPPYTGYYCAEPGSTGGHGVLVIGADPLDVTIENLEISDCDGESNEGCVYLHGAARGTTVRLRNVYLHDGEDLVSFAGDNPGTHIIIENSRFVRGGHNYGGSQHNLYIGGCDPTKGPPCTLDFRNNISEQTVAGHELKTRETTSTVTCNLFKEAYNPLHPGSADIDFSEGRISILNNNVVAIGPAADPNNNDLVRYGLDQEYPSPQNRYFIMQGNLFINDGPPNVGYIEYGPRPYQAALSATVGQVPPGNSTSNIWVGPVGYAGSGPIYLPIPTYAQTPLRKNATSYHLQDVVRVPDNPKYIFAITADGTTALAEPGGYACPGACPAPHGGASGSGTQIKDGSVTLVPILPGEPLPSAGESVYATRASAGLGASEFTRSKACTAPLGNVAVPSN